MQKYPKDIEPGDLFVVNTESEIGGWIAIGQRLIDGKYSQWTHAGIASRWDRRWPVYVDEFGRILPPGRYDDEFAKISDHTLYIVEAQPHGAVEVPWHWQHLPHAWSTGILPACPKAAEAALKYAGYQYQYAGIPGDSAGTWSKVRPGVGYSFLDYGAIATHEKLHFDVPGLQAYIADTGHMICSQLVDQCRQDGDSHLFKDGRWPGYVKPSDIGFLFS